MTDKINKLNFPLVSPKVWTETIPYLLSEEAIIALKVAIATNRPLLISGDPGCGKTTLSKAMAQAQNWNYLKHTLTSRSRLEELTGEIDQLKRLNDAHIQQLNDEWTYLKPGLFWWGFDAESAKYRGRTEKETKEVKHTENYTKPQIPEGLDEKNKGIVILLDEIDKAEPDLPNDLLEPLDQRSFQLTDGTTVQAPSPEELTILTIITTNNERDLPPAFLRRCIHLELKHPDEKTLATIAKYHYPKAPDELCSKLAKKFTELLEATPEGERKPGTSEYLDAVKACMELNVTPDPDNEIWQHIEQATLRKQKNQDKD